ncbi:TetR/AcrR family transcriptional regulator [Microbacterium sp.]|uniref:TetR/AcrR family transcriptional regulator n=1 Tax=Microbacterium sp. TaxID=51671 RepID=UPI003C76E783
MQDLSPATRSRPEVLADAAIHLIATEGLRALTHRAVDRYAELPQGSTSYYAPTRAALLELVARRLAERSLGDLRWLLDVLVSASPDIDHEARVYQIATMLAAFVTRLVERSDDMRARYALVVDFIDREPLRGILTSRSPLLGETLDLARSSLARFGVAATERHVQDLVILTDSIVFSMTVRAGSDGISVDPLGILTAFLRGLPAADLASEPPSSSGR